MIYFYSDTVFELDNETSVREWISQVISEETLKEGDISYVFCDDQQLLDKNIKYLKHNTLTDVISFDYTMGKLLSGDIFISIDRVKENAEHFNVAMKDELHRVMIHGVLHLCGFKDKTKEEMKLMRSKEDYYLSLRAF